MHVLLGRLHPGEDVAQIDQHGVALLHRTQKLHLVELGDQIVEERLHLVAGGALGAFGHGKRQRAAGGLLEPLIAGQQHRLRQIERGEGRIDRKSDDPAGERHFLVGEAPALAAEQDRGGAALPDLSDDLAGRRLRPDHGLGLVMGARGGGEQQRAVGHRRLDAVEQFHRIENVIGPGRRALRRHVRPTVARLHQPQPPQAEIAHGAGGHADVLAELRLHQDHDGSIGLGGRFGLVGARHRLTF